MYMYIQDTWQCVCTIRIGGDLGFLVDVGGGWRSAARFWVRSSADHIHGWNCPCCADTDPKNKESDSFESHRLAPHPGDISLPSTQPYKFPTPGPRSYRLQYKAWGRGCTIYVLFIYGVQYHSITQQQGFFSLSDAPPLPSILMS